MTKQGSEGRQLLGGVWGVFTKSFLNKREQGFKGRQPLGGVWGVPTKSLDYYWGEGRR
jgi:hypothetical protein